MLYPPKIADDDYFINEQEELSEDDEGQRMAESIEIAAENGRMRKGRKNNKLKSRVKAAADGFAVDFNFEVEDGNDGFEVRSKSDGLDHLDGLKKYLKQNSIGETGMSERIRKERKRIGIGGEDIVMELSSDDVDLRSEEPQGQGESQKDEYDYDECTLLQESVNKKDRVKMKPPKSKKAKTDNDQFFDADSRKIAEQANSSQQLTFNDLNLSRPLLKALSEAGFVYPTPVQKACIPVALAGRDICASSATGTGKTAAFMLPILERLLFRPHGKKSVTRILILVPTRELAIQVFQVSRLLSKYTNVEICLAAGGLDIKAQEAALRLGLDIVIATPGRLIDHLYNAPNFSLSDIEVLVLDEADRMLDQQFTDQMKEIIRLCARNRQTMLFSATMTEQVEDLANLSLNKPVRLFINETTKTALNLQQEFIRIRQDRESHREAYVASLITRNFPDHSIIFVRTKWDCERMCVLLGLLGVKSGKLHGGLSQVQRIECLYAFKRQQKVEVLCATDLAARGLDIEGVTTIVNMHMPATLQHYIHRVGRTARAGKAGRSISLIGEQDRKLLKEIAKTNSASHTFPLIQRNIEPDVIEAYISRISGLEQSVEKLIEEEKVEKQLMIAEKSLKQAEKRIKQMDNDKFGDNHLPRTWMNGEITGKDQQKKRNNRIRSKGRRREEHKEKKWKGKMAETEKKMPNQMGRMETKRKKSAFTSEITDINKKAVKRIRHGPDDDEFRKATREKRKVGTIRRKR